MRPVTRHLRTLTPLAVVLAFATLAACAESSAGPASDPLSGMVAQSATDSAGGGIPEPLSPQGNGSVVGTVLAPSLPGAGNDSLATAARIPGVVIRIYPIIGEPELPSPELGAMVATVTTDANGRFQTPTVDGTVEHVLTFTPPSGSGFRAVWARTRFWTGSSTTPWWVTLPRVP